ncbi:hypothetical protein GM3709_3884 (plasmid) [Geminocystis sp. NIES-3709]|nr:hypothetical protein GM3709_3884 [Geminocystis sp. NIES-3709]
MLLVVDANILIGELLRKKGRELNKIVKIIIYYFNNFHCPLPYLNK